LCTRCDTTGSTADLPPLLELYRSDPSDFVATRDRLVRTLKAAGDTQAARDLAKRRKPTRAAHALNQVAAGDPGTLGAYLDLAGDMRRAQIDATRGKDTARDELRRLERERRARADAVLAQVGDDRDDVERALAAALADPEIADAMRAGTLDRLPDTPSGFDAFATDLGDVPAPAARAAERRRRDEAKRVDTELEAARADATAADAAVRTARDALRAAERRAAGAASRVEQLEAQRAGIEDDG
jgi:hypothetical protein